MTYSGVHKIIDNNFIDFIPNDFSSEQILNTTYDVLFLHEKSPDDKLKYERRILRFKTLLENSKEEVIYSDIMNSMNIQIFLMILKMLKN